MDMVASSPVRRPVAVVAPKPNPVGNYQSQPVKAPTTPMTPAMPRQMPPVSAPVSPVPEATNTNMWANRSQPLPTMTFNNNPVNTNSSSVQPVDNEKDEDDDIDQISHDIDQTLRQQPVMSSTSQPEIPPLESPFLPDTKVEKRPLGAFSSMNQSAPISREPIMQQLPTQSPADAKTPLPAELQKDLLSIESDNTTQLPPVLQTRPMSAMNTANRSAGSSNSISKQYQEKISPDSQTNGSIYDTSAYHKALVIPTKKKSGLMVVMWVAILLAIGAGAGIAIYYFVLPLFK
jgi:hypothetical protein